MTGMSFAVSGPVFVHIRQTNFTANTDQLTQLALVAHDLGVVGDIEE